MLKILRTAFLGMLVTALLLPGVAARAEDKALPILFVHGNGDTAALWMTTIWRFESNGYPRELMDAVDFTDPVASAVYDQKQPDRSTAEEATQQLAGAAAALRKRTGAAKIILIGHARGGLIIRNYLRESGAGTTAIAILCSAPDHGLVVSDKLLVGSEFNGASPFLRALNALPDEVVPGVRFMTIRSDGNDKYAQPDGRFLGQPGATTGIGFASPELRGASNVVIPHLDHRETAYGPEAFAAMYRFITGHAPKTLKVRRERNPMLEGKVSAFADGTPTNLGAPGAVIEIYKVSPKTGERVGNAWLRQVTGEDGRWGPLKAESNADYEFVVAVPGFPITHLYRSSFARSSRFVHLRPQLLTKEDREAGAVLYVSRPRGYFAAERDRLLLDGKPPPGIAAGVPSMSLTRLAFPSTPMTIVATLDHERIVTLSWPIKDNQVSVAEFTW
jgi:pimeloyl-ACP methyl ester carboxylesterase